MVRRRQIGISVIEVIMVASAVTFLSATSLYLMKGISNQSRMDQTKMILSRYRAGIRLYRWRVGTFPTALWTTYSFKQNGTQVVSASLYGSGANIPKDPFKGSSTVTYGTAITGVGGWLYDTASGRIWINLSNAEYGPAGTIMKLPENPSSW